MDKVNVTLAQPHKGKKPGDTLSLEPNEAKRLIHAGHAVPAKASDTKDSDTKDDPPKKSY